MWGRGGRL